LTGQNTLWWRNANGDAFAPRSSFIETTAMDYIAIIHKEPNSDFGVSFPDFRGCITAGRTLDEAKDMAAEALTGHIEVMRR
jgi:predicted RNase H-like HicB family nuclease